MILRLRILKTNLCLVNSKTVHSELTIQDSSQSGNILDDCGYDLCMDYSSGASNRSAGISIDLQSRNRKVTFRIHLDSLTLYP